MGICCQHLEEVFGRRQQADLVAQAPQVLSNDLAGIVLNFDQVDVHR